MQVNCEKAHVEEMDDSEDMNEELFLADIEEDEFDKSMEDRISMPFSKLDFEDRYDLQRCLKTNLARRSIEGYGKFLGKVKLKEDISIQDVVKDLALHFLPAKSLCRFRTVSKEWNGWLRSPFFAHKQATHFKDISGVFCQVPGELPFFISLNRYAYGVPSPSLDFLPGIVDIKSACNGLLCCRSCHGDNAYYICNPVTKEWRMLPNSILYHGPETAVALAFEPSVLNFTACFELICAVTLPDSPVLHFEIYSSRTNSWRISDTVCCELGGATLKSDGFFFRGYVYWETNSRVILVFDVSNETYGLFPLPFNTVQTGTLTVMNGEVSYLVPREKGKEYAIELYGDMTMNLKFEIPLNPRFVGGYNESLRALSFVDDDTLIIETGRRVLAYHPRRQTAERLSNTGARGFARYLPYVNSLVSDW